MQSMRVVSEAVPGCELTRRAGRIGMAEYCFEDRAPDDLQLTDYDERHLDAYLQLLDEAATQADWRDTVRCVLGVDAASEPHRAKLIYDTHLARAQWMSEVGYAHLLGSQTKLNR